MKNITKKAYKITDKYDEEIFVVFAETAGKAKSNILYKYDSDTQFNDLIAHRLPIADFFVKKDTTLLKLDWNNLEHQLWLRINLNWLTEEGEERFSCRNCKNRPKCYQYCIDCINNCKDCDTYNYTFIEEICDKYEE